MATAFEFDVTRDASVVARWWSGRARLSERRYRILMNNCEHCCSWALRDECRSRQVECRISSDWTHLISSEWDHPISG